MHVLSMWRDPNAKPPGDEKGQAIWIGGQWEFIAFAFGNVPLRRRCGTLEHARAEAEAYEHAVRSTEREVELHHENCNFESEKDLKEELEFYVDDSTLDKTEVVLHKGYALYTAIDARGAKFFVLVQPDGSLFENVLSDYKHAIAEITASSSNLSHP